MWLLTDDITNAITYINLSVQNFICIRIDIVDLESRVSTCMLAYVTLILF